MLHFNYRRHCEAYKVNLVKRFCMSETSYNVYHRRQAHAYESHNRMKWAERQWQHNLRDDAISANKPASTMISLSAWCEELVNVDREEFFDFYCKIFTKKIFDIFINFSNSSITILMSLCELLNN